ncbi:BnaC05g28800D [Brassica napus]|uniref:BnaC05g28800D protein n=1 Tax=Brassica napus TaxID=3708 RepID=A0A078H479_BRANA|nr:BnaC05g28800D [Brassica napus]
MDELVLVTKSQPYSIPDTPTPSGLPICCRRRTLTPHHRFKSPPHSTPRNLKPLTSSPAIRIYPPRLYEVEKTSIHNKSYLNDQEDEDVLFSGVASGRAGVSCSPLVTYADYNQERIENQIWIMRPRLRHIGSNSQFFSCGCETCNTESFSILE